MNKAYVITFFNNGNIGSELQAYASDSYLRSAGFDVTFVKRGFQHKIFKAVELLRIRAMIMFAPQDIKRIMIIKNEYSRQHTALSIQTKKNITAFSQSKLNSKLITLHTLKKITDGVFICGSDQIWSPLLYPIIKENYLASIPGNKKIAYAPSFGMNEIPKSSEKKIKKYIASFSHIAMRESNAAQFVSNIRKQETQLVVDPVFLLNEYTWSALADSSDLLIDDDYVLCYFLDRPREDDMKYIKEKTNNTKIKYICYKEYFSEFNNAQFVDVGPADFVNLIKRAKIIITDSFHATAFSVIFHKEVITFSRNQPKELCQDGRIESLFSMLNIEGRINNYDMNVKKIDYLSAQEKLDDLVECSKRFYSDSLRAINEEM